MPSTLIFLLLPLASIAQNIGGGAHPQNGGDPNHIGGGVYPASSTTLNPSSPTNGGYPYYTPQAFPDSITSPTACRMDFESLLCDPNEVLSKGNITANHIQISNLLQSIRSTTQCMCAPADSNLGQCQGEGGFSVSVALVSNIKLASDETSRVDRIQAAAKFANTLRAIQGRGQCGDDALVLISKNDRVMWTSVGEVTTRYLTPELISSVTLNAEKFFYNQDWTGGLNYTLSMYSEVMQGRKPDLRPPSGWYWPIPLWAVIVIGIVIGLIVICLIGLSIWGCFKCCCQKNRRQEYEMGVRM